MSQFHTRARTMTVSLALVLYILAVSLSTAPLPGHAMVAAQSCAANCTTGQFFDSGANTCAPCPAGYYCNDTTGAAVPCPPGSASAAIGATASSTCTPCASGYYAATSGNAACNICPAGKACASASAVPVDCVAPQYALAGSTACSSCPTGYYHTAVTNNCTVCPAGSSCANPASAPTTCAPGSYSDGGQTSCTQCAAGQACPNRFSSAAITVCSAGTYSTGGQTSCTNCPLANYCPSTTTATVIPCPAGNYSTGNQAICTACQPGFACDLSGITIVACSPGTYSTGRQTSCTTCPAGSQCPSVSSGPVACNPGTYSTGGQTSCTSCPAGSQCLDTTQSPTACPDGSYSLGAQNCTLCPAGSQCFSKTANPVPCSSGYYALAGQTSCTACNNGLYCPSPTVSPLSCLPGTYTPNTGNHASCTACSDGLYQPSAAQSSCINCDAGHSCLNKSAPAVQCPAGTYSAAGQIGCAQCPSGTYSTAGSPTCSSCPAGNQCLDPAAAPSACPDGTYSISGSAGNCTACPIGTYSSPLKDTCLSCPAGFYCPDPATGPIACPAGFWSRNGTQSSCYVCPVGHQCPTTYDLPIPCTAGTYSPLGATNCTVCPAGFSCSSPTQFPVACNQGSFSLASDLICYSCYPGFSCVTTTEAPTACPVGSYSLGGTANCTLCPAGYACPSTTTAPVACGVGQYAVAGSLNCTNCPAGHACPSTGLAPIACTPGRYAIASQTSCTNCPAGSYCNPADQLPVSCQAGYFSEPGATNCTACPAGHACPLTTTSALNACPAGTFSVGGQTSCTPCPAGKACPYTDQNYQVDCTNGTYSLGSAANCTTCLAGFACPSTQGNQILECAAGQYAAAGSTACSDCPVGSYCPTARTPAPIPCPTGYVAINTAATNCTLCPAGSFCPNGFTQSSCVGGYYSTGGAFNCTACPVGYACPSTSSSNQLLCTAGTYSTGVQQTCQNCPAGFYCPDTTSEPRPCSPGFYSLGGATNCSVCPAGYQCAFANAQPQPCLTGFYSDPQAVVCQPCSPGYLCSGASNTPTPSTLCPRGGYCSFASQFTQCPAGTYGNVTGGTSESQACTACPAGYFCPPGTADYLTNPCPPGFYCPAQTQASNAFPCAEGTYSSAYSISSQSQCTTCPPGRYCPAASTNANALCPAGHFCYASTGDYRQTPCPPGLYTGNVAGLQSQDGCLPCPPGAYCTQGSVDPTLCNPGTYNPDFNSSLSGNCLSCIPGYACPYPGMTNVNTTCAEGHYCPGGTVFATQYPCPPRTYTNATNLVSSAQCTFCPERFACGFGTGGQTNPPAPCAPGYYCPNGTSYTTEYPCPPGTYSANSMLASASECDICPGGSYCLGGGSNITGPCAAGHACPPQTLSPTQYPCPGGTYSNATNLVSTSQCTACPEGFFCPAGSSSPTPCPSGTFANTTGVGNNTQCSTCTAGDFCAQGSIVPQPCGKGKYTVAGDATCRDCKPGFYCPFDRTSEALMLAHPCIAGTFCPGNMTTQPDLLNNACSAGAYCVNATTSEVPCPAGSYNPLTGGTSLQSCLTCPAGYYCIQGAINATGECQPGYYCPAGSIGPTQVACPARTYRTQTRGTNETGCSVCPAGSYCPLASVNPTTCPRGFYCITGTDAPEPCGLGTYGNSTGLRSAEDCTFCPGGYYCDGLGLTTPRGQCDPGFYCIQKAYTSAPPDGPTGGLCPRGGYCTVGSATSTPCPQGTYSNVTGAKNPESCFACDPGFYCGGSQNPFPTGPCDPGYFCSGGAFKSTQEVTPAGTYTTSGSPAPIPCNPGTYQPSSGQGSCLPCLAGYYCPDQRSVNLTACPVGNYCPAGTFTPQRCPAGTYSNTPFLSSQSDCLQCPPGEYCPTNGLTSSFGQCDAGFYCFNGSSSRQPVGQSYGDRCPAGSYCPQGTSVPKRCPVGTFSGAVGNTNITDCLDCPPGKHCNDTGLAAAAGDCAAGFYCSGRAKTPAITPDDSTGGICPLGHYCPAGSPTPLTCSAGTYANVTGLSACLQCPGGYQCTSPFINPVLCGPGLHCAPGTGNTPGQCNPGTYSSRSGLSSQLECENCPGGKACTVPGLTAPDRNCSAGYYCTQGQSSPTPAIANANGGPCPAGRYCPEGTSIGQTCPQGTYLGSTGNTQESDCVACDGGYYCNSTGLAAPVGKCAPGYYCLSRAVSRTPPNDATGAICPAGSACPEGSAQPQSCAAGTFSNVQGRAECAVCPSGYYCLANSTTFTGNPCPAGFYCPNGTRFANEYPCPLGTFSNQAQRQDVSSCLDCTPGSYCATVGITKPTNTCAPGWYCLGKASTPTPPGDSTGGRCQAGSYCPAGSPAAYTCPGGQYCETIGLSEPTGSCLPGYYCPPGSSSKVQVSCPQGHYCPANSSAQVPCPKGTFSSATNNQNISDCMACTPGQYCPNAGSTAPFGPCNATFYCPAGQFEPSPSAYICPAGSFCETGSSSPRQCFPGTYQDQQGRSSCLDCPEGYYCGVSNSDQLLECPKGFYCPAKTNASNQYPCPAGTYNNKTRQIDSGACLQCTPGKFCSGTGNPLPDGDCTAGFFCTAGSQFSTPLAGTGGECPAGSYCPVGSTTPQACPAGTYSLTARGTSLGDCLSCAQGRYCPTTGTDNLNNICAGGYVCTGSSITATPNNSSQGGFPCPAGTHCPAGTTQVLGCPPGTYSPTEALASCLACPPGYYCDQWNMTSFRDCPATKYCPLNTSVPINCPAGTYSNVTLRKADTECTPCDTGYYCNTTGLAAPTAQCAAGFYCASGAASPTPAGAFPSNGPCPRGHWCATGTLAPTACSAGSYLPSLQNDAPADCLDCAPGSYCATAGLPAPTGPCAAGFYCPSGIAQTVSQPSSYVCPIGHYCPQGSSQPLGCVDGYFQDTMQQSTCKPCPGGFQCNNNATAPVECPVSTYCPVATGYATLCPNGTFGQRSQLNSSEQCTPCPPGQFCQAGIVQGFCTAGYYCSGGASVPRPVDGVTGNICPAGYFCPNASSSPIVCANQTYSPSTGSIASSNCLPCPAGFRCVVGDPVPKACVAGEYCPYGEGRSLCPVGTYSTTQKATNASACLTCPAGYLCDSAGTGDFNTVPCPAGGWCEAGTGVFATCPGGTYNPNLRGTTSAVCVQCPAGRYCPVGTGTPIVCPPGAYCTAGSANQTECPSGTFCPSGSSTFSQCPAGFYCPSGTNNPVPCPQGHYCPTGSRFALLCPIGTYSPNDTVARHNVTSTCVACPRGTYSNWDRLRCLTCDAGYVCAGSAHNPRPANLTEGGYPCPKGHYCPAGITLEQPCSPGEYLPTTKASSKDECIPCAAGSYNQLSGQPACFKCGRSSFSLPGALTCSCNGTNRAFQTSDGACLCEPGFESFNIDGVREPGDSTVACQPIVQPRCAVGVPRNATGACVQVGSPCDDQCVNGQGQYDNDGLCVCDTLQDPEGVCDSKCRRDQSYLALDSTAPGFARLYVPTTNATKLVPLDTNPGFVGSVECTGDTVTCTFQVMTMSGLGFRGVYNPSNDYLAGLFGFLSAANLTSDKPLSVVGGGQAGDPPVVLMGKESDARQRFGSTTSAGRRLLQSGSTTVQTGVDQPLVCLEQNEGMFFEVSADRQHYPVYEKDSLFNSNPNFDYGEFRRLDTRMKSNLTITTFGYTFTQAGTYVFSDAGNPSLRTVIVVLATGLQCPGTARIQPMTAANLVNYGVRNSSNIMQAPDWVLVGLILAALALVVVSVIVGMHYFRKRSWGSVDAKVPKYRALGQKAMMTEFSSKGSQLKKMLKYKKTLESGKTVVDMEAFESDIWDYENQIDLENFNVKTLYSKLDDYIDRVSAMMHKANDGVQKFYDRVTEETEQLKNMVNAKIDILTARDKPSAEALEQAAQRLADTESEMERRGMLAVEIDDVQNAQSELLKGEVAKRTAYVLSSSKLLAGARRLQARVVKNINEVLDLDRTMETSESQALLDNLELVTKFMRQYADMVLREAARRNVYLNGASNGDGDSGAGTGSAALEGASEAQLGGQLLDPDTDKPVSLERLTDEKGNLWEVEGIIHEDRNLRLFVPTRGVKMVTASGEVMRVPDDYFVHPATGRVLPIAGNLMVDVTRGKLVYPGAKTNGKVAPTVVPYVSAPVDNDTGAPMLSDELRAMRAQMTLVQDGEAQVIDDDTGMRVPVIAATMDFETHQVVPLGGTHKDIITGLPVPIEIGEMMKDEQSRVVPITGIRIDRTSGKLKAVGGVDTRSGNVIMEGDTMRDPLSGLEVYVSGATANADTGEPVAVSGGVLGIVDPLELGNDLRQFDALINTQRAARDAIDRTAKLLDEDLDSRDKVTKMRTEFLSIKSDLSSTLNTFDTEIQSLHATAENARESAITYFVRRQYRAKVRKLANELLKKTKGKEGMMIDPVSGDQVPILVGGSMLDRSSHLVCPILGVCEDPNTGKIVPLGGSMTDPFGGQTIPILIGGRIRDPQSGAILSISGAALDSLTSKVIPISHKSNYMSSGLITSYDSKTLSNEAESQIKDELSARNVYVRTQKRLLDAERGDSLLGLQNKLLGMLESITRMDFDEDSADLVASMVVENVPVKQMNETLKKMSDALEKVKERADKERERRSKVADKLEDTIGRVRAQEFKEAADLQVAIEDRFVQLSSKIRDPLRAAVESIASTVETVQRELEEAEEDDESAGMSMDKAEDYVRMVVQEATRAIQSFRQQQRRSGNDGEAGSSSSAQVRVEASWEQQQQEALVELQHLQLRGAVRRLHVKVSFDEERGGRLQVQEETNAPGSNAAGVLPNDLMNMMAGLAQLMMSQQPGAAGAAGAMGPQGEPGANGANAMASLFANLAAQQKGAAGGQAPPAPGMFLPGGMGGSSSAGFGAPGSLVGGTGLPSAQPASANYTPGAEGGISQPGGIIGGATGAVGNARAVSGQSGSSMAGGGYMPGQGSLGGIGGGFSAPAGTSGHDGIGGGTSSSIELKGGMAGLVGGASQAPSLGQFSDPSLFPEGNDGAARANMDAQARAEEVLRKNREYMDQMRKAKDNARARAEQDLQARLQERQRRREEHNAKKQSGAVEDNAEADEEFEAQLNDEVPLPEDLNDTLEEEAEELKATLPESQNIQLPEGGDEGGEDLSSEAAALMEQGADAVRKQQQLKNKARAQAEARLAERLAKRQELREASKKQSESETGVAEVNVATLDELDTELPLPDIDVITNVQVPEDELPEPVDDSLDDLAAELERDDNEEAQRLVMASTQHALAAQRQQAEMRARSDEALKQQLAEKRKKREEEKKRKLAALQAKQLAEAKKAEEEDEAELRELEEKLERQAEERRQKLEARKKQIIEAKKEEVRAQSGAEPDEDQLKRIMEEAREAESALQEQQEQERIQQKALMKEKVMKKKRERERRRRAEAEKTKAEEVARLRDEDRAAREEEAAAIRAAVEEQERQAAAEKERQLQIQLAQKEAQEQAKIEAETQANLAAVQSQRQAAESKGDSAGVQRSEQEAMKLMQEKQERQRKLQEQTAVSRIKAQQELEERIRKKKEKRLQAVEAQLANEDDEPLELPDAEEVDDLELNEIVEEFAADVEAVAASEEEREERQQQAAALKEKEEENKEKLKKEMEEMEAEAAAEEARLAEEFEKEQAALEAKQQAELEAAQQADGEMAAEIAAQYQENKERAAQALNDERQRALERQRRLVEEKKRKKREEAKRKMQLEKNRELLDQKKNNAEQRESQKERERERLEAMIENVAEDARVDFIENFVQVRFQTEMNDLLERLQKESQLAVREALEDQRVRQDDEIYEVRKEMENKLTEIAKAMVGKDPLEVDEAKSKVRTEYTERIDAMKAENTKENYKVESETLAASAATVKSEREALVSRQSKELKQYLQEFGPPDAVAELEEAKEKAKREKEEALLKLKQEQEEILEAQKRQLQEMQEQKLRMEREMKEKLEKEMKEMEKQFKEEEERERAQAADREAQLERTRLRMAEEAERRRKEQEEKMGDVTEEQRRELMERFNQEMEEAMNQAQTEKTRQQLEIQRRVAERRARKRKKKERELAQKQSQLEKENAEKLSEMEQAAVKDQLEKEAELQRKKEQASAKLAEEKEAKEKKEKMRRAAAATMGKGPNAGGPVSPTSSDEQGSLQGTVVASPMASGGGMGSSSGSGMGGGSGTMTAQTVQVVRGGAMSSDQPMVAMPASMAMMAGSEEQLFAMLKQSPLYRKMEQIEGILRSAGMGAQGSEQESTVEAYKGNEGALHPLNAEAMSARQFVVYRFGEYVMELLSQHAGMLPVDVLVASALPANNYANNEFRSVIFFDEGARVLYIREKCLENVGEYLLILTHSLAHIVTYSGFDDNNSEFRKQFHAALKVILTEFFVSRSKKSMISTGNKSGNDPIEEVFSMGVESGSSRLAIAESLVNVKVSGSGQDDGHFSKEKLEERMSMYAEFKRSKKLRDYLMEIEGKIAEGEAADNTFVDKRWMELSSDAEKAEEAESRRAREKKREEEAAVEAVEAASSSSSGSVDQDKRALAIQSLENKLEEVENKLDALNAKDLQMRMKQKNLVSELRTSQPAVQAIQAELKTMQPGSDEYEAMKLELKKQAMKLQKLKQVVEKIQVGLKQNSGNIEKLKEMQQKIKERLAPLRA